MSVNISKSRFLSGLQCSKLLWYQYNKKEDIPPYKGMQVATFEQGHDVGELAKNLYPDGIEVDWGVSSYDYKSGLQSTQELLAKRVPLFEAGFSAGDVHSRADVLVPVDKGAWDIVEVKSATGVNEINIQDVAVQKYCYEKAGITIKNCYVMHVNSDYIRDGEINPYDLLIKDNITEKVECFSPAVPALLESMQNKISLCKCPEVAIGKHCLKPYTCPMKSVCWDFLPEHNTKTLPRYRGWAEDFNNGVYSLFDLDYNSLPQNYQTIYASAETGQPYIDQASIRDFIAKLEFPLYFLDFETMTSAVPLFDRSKPYQQIPFQYSLHVLDSIDGEARHYEFLASGVKDPRDDFISSLTKNLGNSGSIIVYNQSFEISRLQEAAKYYPAIQIWVDSVVSRIVDLLKPFRSQYCYHPQQHGSNSIKKVLPAWTELSYDGMDIADGMAAASEFARVTFGEGVIDDDRNKVRSGLLKYCELDTWAMVVLLRKLYSLI